MRLATIGYALPGTVLAVGLLIPVASLDNWIADRFDQWFGVSVGLIVLGSGAALIFAYVLRFLPIAVGNAESGFAKISPSLDMAARSLGAGPLETAARVHLPILRPALAAGALIVFVDCMKELPATLLLRPFGVETLSTQLFAEAQRGTYEVGAVSALAIVLVGLFPGDSPGADDRARLPLPARAEVLYLGRRLAPPPIRPYAKDAENSGKRGHPIVAMKRLAIILAAVIVLVTGILIVAPLFIPKELARVRIAEQIEQWIGRPVTFTGEPAISFFPRPTVRLENVAITDGDGSGNSFISVDELTGTVRLLPLAVRPRRGQLVPLGAANDFAACR